MKIDPSEISIIGWMRKYDIKTENGKPYDFKSHSFWYDPLRDWNPKQVWFKAAQVGGTTSALLKLVFAMKKYGMNAAYTMPTASDVKDLVSGKLNPLVAQNPVLQGWVLDKDSVEQKRIGDHTAYFRGTWTDRAALSFSSDINVHDEEDRSKPDIVAQYASRQQHSPFKWQWHFSNPSVEGNGVARYWKDSDQRHWFITCSPCGKKQFLSWPESVDPERGAFVCKHCHRVLADEDRRKGSWHGIITDTKPEYSGYWFSLLMCPWVTAPEIVKYSREKSPEYFANFVLGLPFIGNGNKLTEDEFFANLETGKNTQDDPVAIGLDTGLPNWLSIMNRQGYFYNARTDGYDEVRRLLRRFTRSILVADQGGDLIGVRELQEEFPGRVFLCYYRSDRKTMRLVEWGKGEEAGKVIVDRNRMMQQLLDELRAERIPLFGTKTDWWEAWTHFANIYRTVEEDLAGNERFVWARSGPDHLVHAMLYARIGMDKFGMADTTHVSGFDAMDAMGAKKSFDVLEGLKLPTPEEVYEDNYDWRRV